MTARPAFSPPQAFADDTAGFDYFATDFHHVNVVAEIRRLLAERRGFVLLSGPPTPDGNLVVRYLDKVSDAADTEGATYRATLITCLAGSSFEDVMAAYGRALDLRLDPGEDRAWQILSQTMQESRRDITRVLVIENAEALDDRSFDELSRFARLDEPYVLPIVLLTGDGFSERLDATLQFLKPSIIAILPMLHLAPAEVAAFIHHQIEPIGAGLEQAFTSETVSAIAKAARGDPRVVNRLARQGLALFSRSRALLASVAPSVEEAPEDDGTSVGTSAAPAFKALPAAAEPRAAAPAVAEGEPPVLEAKPPVIFALPAPSGGTVESQALVRTRQPSRRALSFSLLSATAYLLLIVAGAGATLYALFPAPSLDAARLASVQADVAYPLQPTADHSRAAPASAEKTADAPPPPPPPPPAAVERTAVATPAPSAAQTPPPVPPPAPAPVPEKIAAAPEPAAPSMATNNDAPAPTPLDDSVARKVAAIEPSAPPPGEAVAVAEPEAAPPRVLPADPRPSGITGLLVERGNRLLAAGDVASARQFFERAAEAGEATGSCGLAKSYDPLFLRRIATRGVAGDVKKAATWYRRAAAAGSGEAAERLAQLLAKYPLAISSDDAGR